LLDGRSGLIDLGEEALLDGAGLLRTHLHEDEWKFAFSLSHLSLIRILIEASQLDLGELLGLDVLELGMVAGLLGDGSVLVIETDVLTTTFLVFFETVVEIDFSTTVVLEVDLEK
jgi:hypothetical protein